MIEPTGKYYIYKEAVELAFKDYLSRLTFINMDKPETIQMSFDAILNELGSLLTNRKFLLLNTNVLRTNHTRVMSSSTIRNMYFEIFSSVVTYIRQQYGHVVVDNMTEDILLTILEYPPLYLSRANSGERAKAQIVEYSSAELDMSSQMYSTSEAKSYLDENSWYVVYILCHEHATSLIEIIHSMMTVKQSGN
jgi:hypothetical protein